MPTKPHIVFQNGERVEVTRADPLAKPRARFSGRKFIHEQGSDFEADAEPVLSRWLRKADWRNVKGRTK